VRRQSRQSFAELEIVGELGAGLRLTGTNSRTEAAARPDFLAQGPDQRGIFAKTLDEDCTRAFESSGRINHPLVRFDVPPSHLFQALIGFCQKRLGQRLEARFACDLSFCPTLRTIGQIEIFEPRLAVRGIYSLFERRVEFPLLSDAVEDRGPTLVELPQISQPLLEPAQLGVIERPGRLLPVAGNKGHGRSAIEQRDGRNDLVRADAQFLSDAKINRLHRFLSYFLDGSETA